MMKYLADLKEVGELFLYVISTVLERLGDWWRVASRRQRAILIAVTAVPLLLLSTCVVAAEEPDAAYTVIAFNTPTGEQRFLCHLAKGVPVTGEVSLCLYAEPVSPQFMMTTNMSIWCAVNSIHDSGQPAWTCGSWEQIQEKLTGI